MDTHSLIKSIDNLYFGTLSLYHFGTSLFEIKLNIYSFIYYFQALEKINAVN